MPQLDPNHHVINKAINGPKCDYTIKGQPGLYLRVVGNGRASWRIRYCLTPKAKQSWFTLTTDAKNADYIDIRKRAAELLAAVRAHAIDPHVTTPPSKPAGMSLEEAFRLWLDHTGKRRHKHLSPRTRQGYEDLFKLHIQKELGDTAVTALTRTAIQRTIERIKVATSDPSKHQRGTQATKALKLISSILEWCADQETIERNPARGIAPPTPIHNPAGKQARPPTNPELRQLWNEAPNIMTPVQCRVLKLAILLGRRISELAGAERVDVRVDLPTPCLVIPATREGNKAKRDDAVPLPPLALSIIEDALSATKPDQTLFHGAATRWTTSKVLTTVRRAWGWPAPPVRFHDFRGLINDQMAALGISTELRSRTLHHTGDLRQLSNTVYSAYDFIPERLRALEQWEARLLQIVSGEPDPARHHSFRSPS